jgi:hypothetical protein
LVSVLESWTRERRWWYPLLRERELCLLRAQQRSARLLPRLSYPLGRQVLQVLIQEHCPSENPRRHLDLSLDLVLVSVIQHKENTQEEDPQLELWTSSAINLACVTEDSLNANSYVHCLRSDDLMLPLYPYTAIPSSPPILFFGFILFHASTVIDSSGFLPVALAR